jgi:ABC-2 type transport system permease protein
VKKALLVARWEFTRTVTRRAYIFAVIAMPLFYGGMVALAALAGRSASTNAGRIPTAIVDKAHIVNLEAAREEAARRDRDGAADPGLAIGNIVPQAPLVDYVDFDAALAALRERKVATVFVIDADYLNTGAITVYTRETSVFAQQADRQRQAQVADAIRTGLLRPVLPDETLARAYAPAARLKRMRLTAQGTFEPAGDSTGLGPFAGSFGVFLLFSLSIFFSAGFLGQATIEDRQSRMIEILLSSIEPDELVLGKILGLGGAGLLQVGIYVALVIAPGATVFALFQVPMAKLALSIGYYIVGYLIFACLMTWTGMIGRTAQESGQLSALWMFAAASPMFFIANIGAAPNGPLARGLSLFPLTSPVTMMLRIASSDVPAGDVAASMGIDIVAIYLALRAAAKIFRGAALMYGKRPTLPEIIRWMRAA